MDKKKYILYVEDDPGSRKVMRILVERLEDSVQLVILDDSTDFMQTVHQQDVSFDIFLLDIHVVPHDGFQMLEMIRKDEHYADKMVVALTASVMNEEINRLREAGFDGVLAKPLNFHSFPATFERILNGEHIWTVNR